MFCHQNVAGINPLESTISGTLHPICVRFHAYNTKVMLKDVRWAFHLDILRFWIVASSNPCKPGFLLLQVLRRDHVRILVTGAVLDAASPNHGFQRVAYDSFVDTLVQALQMTTTNVKEISHVGQRLWPKYVEPLQSRESINRTLQQARRNLAAASNPVPDRASMQREVLSILDRAIRPVLLATTAGGALGLLPLEPQPSSSPSSDPYFELPLLAKYMLLSAYLCQINRPERDKDLFSVESNGKRRRTDADSQHQDPEGMGGTTTSAHPSNSLPRPRTFALERMLSVYASVVGLAASSIADDDRSRALGGAAFYDNLAHLCDIGLLHEHPSQSGYEISRLNDPRYWTSISADDAKSMAKSLSFPLDSYIL
jgi:Origin recognition complex (ORC) subunit 5 C-terminus